MLQCCSTSNAQQLPCFACHITAGIFDFVTWPGRHGCYIGNIALGYCVNTTEAALCVAILSKLHGRTTVDALQHKLPFMICVLLYVMLHMLLYSSL